MSPKVIIHAVVLAAVLIFELWLWNTADSAKEGEAIFTKMIAFIVGALYLGFMTVVYILPAITGKITEEALGSTEDSEPDPFAVAHSKMAAGEYEEAIQAFRSAAAEDPDNRMPWMEISKIWLTHFEDPDAAIASLTNALESKEWPVNDAAALMFKIEEIYDKHKEDQESAKAILNQIIATFPETRHSANATHKLREMGAL